MGKNIEEMFSKLIYVVEFLVSIILVKSIFDFICAKEYDQIILKSRIFLIVIGVVALIGIAIYVLKKYKGMPEKLFLLFVIPVGLGFSIFMMAPTVPDEGNHIIRAYDVSKGNLITQTNENGEAYVTAAEELKDYQWWKFYNYNFSVKKLSRDTDYTKIIQLTTSAQAYSFLLYIGPAIAFAIFRLVNLNIWLAIYAGRILNFLIFIIFGYFSIKKIPFGKYILAVLLCTPMILQQAASCSADAILNSVLVYYMAHLVYIMFKKSKITRKDEIILYILTALVGMFKYIYVICAGVLFIKLLNEKENRKSNLKMIIIMIIIGSVFSITSFVFFTRYKTNDSTFESYYEKNNVNSIEQVNYIKDNFSNFTGLLAQKYYNDSFSLLLESIGWKLASLNIEIRIEIPITFIILLLTAAITENSEFEFNKKEKIWVIAVFFIISLVIFSAMYIGFSTVGGDFINGVQGRYFTPVILLIFLCFVQKNQFLKIKNSIEKLLIASFILNIMTLVTVVMSYI